MAGKDLLRNEIQVINPSKLLGVAGNYHWVFIQPRLRKIHQEQHREN